MKKIFFLTILITLCFVSSAVMFAAADEMGYYVDFEKYPVDAADLDKLYANDNIYATKDDLYIEEENGNKFLRSAVSNSSGYSANSIFAIYDLNLTEETLFKFDIQNRNSNTGYANIQLRQNGSSTFETRKNIFYPVEIRDNKIIYLGDFEDYKYTEDISDDEKVSIAILLNPETEEIKIFKNGILKAHAIAGDNFDGFDFKKTIFRFQNYVKATPKGESPYVANIIYDNIAVIHGKNEVINLSADVFYNEFEVSELKKGSLNAKASVINKSASDKNLMLFVTHKSDGQLVNLGLDKRTVGFGEQEYFTAPISITDTKAGDYMEVMLLDADTLKPVISPKKVYFKNIIETPVADEMRDIYNIKKSSHPRLVANNTDFLRISSLSETDETIGAWKSSIIDEADRIADVSISDSTLDDYYLEHSDSMLDTSRNALRMVQTLGIAHKLSGLEISKYSQKAELILKTVSEYPDWNPSHFLDTAEMMTALAFGYDWMGDAFSDETNEAVKTAVYEKGLLAADKAYNGTGGTENSGWWKNVDYNWNIVCNGAIAVTASAFADVYPGLCFDLSAKAVNYVKYALKPFAPDGGGEEGCEYTVYALRYLSKLHTTLLNTYGTDFGMMKHSGLSGLGDFLIQADGSSGINSYHDTNGGENYIDTPALLWLGNVYDKTYYTAARLRSIKRYNFTVTPFDLIWYNSDVTDSDFTDIPLNSYFENTELISMRSGFDADDIYLSAHGGKANVSHSHIDGGTFVLDMQGFRVGADIGADVYDAEGYFGKRRYEYYRTRAEGHNTIVINPDESPGQSTDSNIEFIKVNFEDESPYAILDMTDAYKEYNCTSAKRGYRLEDNLKSAVIRDELTLSEESDIYWFMQTKANVTASGNTLTIIGENGETVIAEFLTNVSSYSLTVGDAIPLKESNSTVTNSLNTSYKRVQFKVTASENVQITVKFTPQSGGFSDIKDIKNLIEW